MPCNELDKIALTAGSLFLVCLTGLIATAVLYEHPPGRVRTNSTILSSKVVPGSTPPHVVVAWDVVFSTRPKTKEQPRTVFTVITARFSVLDNGEEEAEKWHAGTERKVLYDAEVPETAVWDSAYSSGLLIGVIFFAAATAAVIGVSVGFVIFLLCVLRGLQDD